MVFGNNLKIDSFYICYMALSYKNAQLGVPNKFCRIERQNL